MSNDASVEVGPLADKVRSYRQQPSNINLGTTDRPLLQFLTAIAKRFLVGIMYAARGTASHLGEAGCIQEPWNIQAVKALIPHRVAIGSPRSPAMTKRTVFPDHHLPGYDYH